MADTHLKLEPHNISPSFWWYEDAKGITVVACGVVYPTIKWDNLRNALKRKDKK